MKTETTVLALTLALTACAAPEPIAPIPGIPAAPAALPSLDAVPAAVPAPIQLAQAHPKPGPPDLMYGKPHVGRNPIIQFSDLEPKTYADMQEDLSVMHRILSKARADDPGFSARLESIVWGASEAGPPVRSMYLEGYGAVFLLHVKFPLVGPKSLEPEPKPKDNISEEWERAKAELSSRNTFELNLQRIITRAAGPAADKYDAQKVEELTVTVLEALKNGTHIRHLMPEEAITVAILGPEPAIRVAVENEDESGEVKRRTRVESIGPRGESTMTIRAKKSDIDDFAKGKVDLDAFRKKAKILVYTRPGDPSAAVNVFAAPKPPRQ